MYKKGAGNDKQRKDAGNRTLCPYRNFSQAIMDLTNRSERYRGALLFIDLCTMVRVSKSINCWTFNHFKFVSKVSGSTDPYVVLIGPVLKCLKFTFKEITTVTPDSIAISQT